MVENNSHASTLRNATDVRDGGRNWWKTSDEPRPEHCCEGGAATAGRTHGRYVGTTARVVGVLRRYASRPNANTDVGTDTDDCRFEGRGTSAPGYRRRLVAPDRSPPIPPWHAVRYPKASVGPL